MWYNLIKRMIQRGQADGLAARVNVMYAYGQMTDAQYIELMELLEGGKADE